MSQHFSSDEMACRCCGVNYCTEPLMLALEELRALIGLPIAITSGYRCPERNREVGGEPNSMHLRGMAADIKVVGMTGAELYRLAVQIPRFGGFGVAERFLHVDVRPVHAKWCYGADGKQCAWNPQIEVLA